MKNAMRTHAAVAAAALLGAGLLSATTLAAPDAPASTHHANLESEVLVWPVGEVERVNILSGPLVNLENERAVIYDRLVSMPTAGWLRIYFGDVVLDKGSVIRITSLFDDEVQVLDEGTLQMWSNTSAYFNGNSVRVEVIAEPMSLANSIAIEYLAFQDVATIERGDNCGICGSDDRVSASADEFARVYPVGCSSTLYNDESCFVTAGHCLSGASVVQFRVPASDSNCNTNNPGVNDQFPITGMDGYAGDLGDDYGAMKAGTNGAGETPSERYGVFVPPASSVPGSGNATVTGYGVDSYCPDSQTLQTHSGPINGVSGSTLIYNIDATFGNSGSSIVYNGQIIGVVTHCSYSCENYGTTITDSGFQSVMESVCAGGGGGGDCAAGEIEDCFGNCCPDSWVGDGYCDDGTYSWNGVPIYLNCDEFDCDAGDCPPESCGGGGGDEYGACCIGESCVDELTADDCNGLGGEYQGDGSSCDSVNCGGGGGGDCPAGEIEDCFGNCCPDFWVGDGYCDDGTYSWNGVPIYLNCDEFDCDAGDCPPESCDGGGGGDCPAGEIEDCFGNCCPDFWVGDGYCDDGTYSWNGVPIYLNCDEFDCDAGDCPPESCKGGGGGTGACCIGESCTNGQTSDECAAQGGQYQGDGTDCGGVSCGGGGGDSTLDVTGMDSNDGYQSGVNVMATMTIPAGANITGVGWNNVTFSAYDPSWGSEAGIMFHWESDGEPFAGYILIFDGESAPGDYGPSTDFTDLTADWNFSDADGVIEVEFFETYDDFPGETDGTWTGGEIYLTHDGDGGGGGTGACCIDTDCVSDFSSDECAQFGGEYQGDDSTCESDTCGTPCEGDTNGDGIVNVTDLLAAIAEWQCTSDCTADVNGDGIVNVSDLLAIIGAWGPC